MCASLFKKMGSSLTTARIAFRFQNKDESCTCSHREHPGALPGILSAKGIKRVLRLSHNFVESGLNFGSSHQIRPSLLGLEPCEVRAKVFNYQFCAFQLQSVARVTVWQLRAQRIRQPGN